MQRDEGKFGIDVCIDTSTEHGTEHGDLHGLQSTPVQAQDLSEKVDLMQYGKPQDPPA